MDRVRITNQRMSSMVLQRVFGRYLGSNEAKQLVSGQKTISEIESAAAKRKHPEEQIILPFPGVAPQES